MQNCFAITYHALSKHCTNPNFNLLYCIVKNRIRQSLPILQERINSMFFCLYVHTNFMKQNTIYNFKKAGKLL